MTPWQSPKLATAALVIVAAVTASFSLPFRPPVLPEQEIVQATEPVLDFEERWSPVNLLPPMVIGVKTLSFMQSQSVSDLAISKIPIVGDHNGIVRPAVTPRRGMTRLGEANRGWARPGVARQGEDSINRSKAVCNQNGLRTVWNGRWTWRCQR